MKATLEAPKRWKSNKTSNQREAKHRRIKKESISSFAFASVYVCACASLSLPLTTSPSFASVRCVVAIAQGLRPSALLSKTETLADDGSKKRGRVVPATSSTRTATSKLRRTTAVWALMMCYRRCPTSGAMLSIFGMKGQIEQRLVETRIVVDRR